MVRKETLLHARITSNADQTRQTTSEHIKSGLLDQEVDVGSHLIFKCVLVYASLSSDVLDNQLSIVVGLVVHRSGNAIVQNGYFCV